MQKPMTTPNPVPQWAVDAAKAHYQPIFDLFPDDLGEREEAVHALAAIIARHAPDDADRRRLDWLEKAKSAYYYEGSCNWRINEDKATERDYLRDAIDAAMREGGR